MRQVVIILASTFALSACFSWKGDGTDEVLPDAIGLASKGDVKPAFGVPSQSINDHADVDIRENHKAEGGHEEHHAAMPHSAEGHAPAQPAPKEE